MSKVNVLLVVVVVVLVIWLAGYRLGKNDGQTSVLLPSGTGTDQIRWGRSLAEQVYSAIGQGYGMDSEAKRKAMVVLLELPDSSLIEARNFYLQSFKRSMYKDIQDETWWGLDNSLQMAALARLRTLNLY